MASNYTENYGLCQWEATDQVLRTEFNEDNAKVDAALGTLSEIVAKHTAAMAGFGNCKIESFSYTGTGTYGVNSPTRITFPKQPMLFFILGQTQFMTASKLTQRGTAIKFEGYGASVFAPMLTWNNNQVSFYDGSDANGQLNGTGITYWVFALYAEDEM